MLNLTSDAEQTLVTLNGKLTKLRSDLLKINKAVQTELQVCVRNFNETSTPICKKADELLKNISTFPVEIKGVSVFLFFIYITCSDVFFMYCLLYLLLLSVSFWFKHITKE